MSAKQAEGVRRKPTFVTLGRWTEPAARNPKEGPQRRERTRCAVEEAGGRLIGAYLTMGRCDVDFLTEFPGEEVATVAFLAVGAMGNLCTETLRAFTAEEVDRIVQRIPSP